MVGSRFVFLIVHIAVRKGVMRGKLPRFIRLAVTLHASGFTYYLVQYLANNNFPVSPSGQLAAAGQRHEYLPERELSHIRFSLPVPETDPLEDQLRVPHCFLTPLSPDCESSEMRIESREQRGNGS